MKCVVCNQPGRHPICERVGATHSSGLQIGSHKRDGAWYMTASEAAKMRRVKNYSLNFLDKSKAEKIGE